MMITFVAITLHFMLCHVLLERIALTKQIGLPPWLLPRFLGSLGCDGGGMTLLTKWCLLNSK